MYNKKAEINNKVVCLLVLFIFSTVLLLSDFLRLKNSTAAELGLPEPTSLVAMSANYNPPLLKGIKIDPKNPLKCDFIFDTFGKNLSENDSQRLVRYFLTALSVPEEKLWVNLSPYEKDRIIDPALEQTELGRELMAQDYILKQLSSSLTNPDTELGKNYWNSIDVGAQHAAPSSSFNKIWIVPDNIEIYQDNNTAIITDATLDVMTEQDYLSSSFSAISTVGAQHAAPGIKDGLQTDSTANKINNLILPKIKQDVNSGRNFAKLRQLYSSIILASWFKQNLGGLTLSAYRNSENMMGLDKVDSALKQKVYDLYVESFKKGVYNKVANEGGVKRNYFSGGFKPYKLKQKSRSNTHKDFNKIDISSAIVKKVEFRAIDGASSSVVNSEKDKLKELKKKPFKKLTEAEIELLLNNARGLVVTGIVGAGKSSFIADLIKEYQHMFTRPKWTMVKGGTDMWHSNRNKEVASKIYKQLKRHGRFIIEVRSHAKKYGLDVKDLVKAIQKDKFVVFEVSSKENLEKIVKKMPNLRTILMTPFAKNEYLDKTPEDVEKIVSARLDSMDISDGEKERRLYEAKRDYQSFKGFQFDDYYVNKQGDKEEHEKQFDLKILSKVMKGDLYSNPAWFETMITDMAYYYLEHFDEKGVNDNMLDNSVFAHIVSIPKKMDQVVEEEAKKKTEIVNKLGNDGYTHRNIAQRIEEIKKHITQDKDITLNGIHSNVARRIAALEVLGRLLTEDNVKYRTIIFEKMLLYMVMFTKQYKDYVKKFGPAHGETIKSLEANKRLYINFSLEKYFATPEFIDFLMEEKVRVITGTMLFVPRGMTETVLEIIDDILKTILVHKAHPEDIRAAYKRAEDKRLFDGLDYDVEASAQNIFESPRIGEETYKALAKINYESGLIVKKKSSSSSMKANTGGVDLSSLSYSFVANQDNKILSKDYNVAITFDVMSSQKFNNVEFYEYLSPIK